ncbi:MAG: BatA domain-containing protein, partial [Gemmatimonadales bacterium]
MTWLNPWAWAGLVVVGLPVFIHLLGRARARPQRFPTLRFVDPSRLLPRRFTRPHDPLVLAVRVLIFAAAVAAL